MDVLLGVLVFVIVIGALLAVSGMITAALSCAVRAVSGCGGASAAARALHAERVLAHFERMRDAVLAGDDARLQRLEDQLLEIDPAAWADYREQLREGARRAGIKLD